MRGTIALFSACVLGLTAPLTTSVSATELPCPGPAGTAVAAPPYAVAAPPYQGPSEGAPGVACPGPAGIAVAAPPYQGPSEGAPGVTFDTGPLLAGVAAAGLIAGVVTAAEIQNGQPGAPVSPGANTNGGRR